jgi:hypothetical protein
MAAHLVSGITFIKNGLTLGYPIKESIESIEPICDEIIINVGFENSNLTEDDGTFEYLRDTFNHPKFVFVKSFWDPEISSRGEILSQQTNIALSKARGKICQYIQGDEVIHETDLKKIHSEIINLEKTPGLEGLVYNFVHFYGNVDVIKHTRNVYRREVRTFKNKNVQSWLDAQGFRHLDKTKLLCKNIDARIFHYGWARKETVMTKKVQKMNKLYHGKGFESEAFQYKRIWGLKPFIDTHPKVMTNWIEQNKNDLDIFSLNLHKEKNILGLAVSDFIENLTGYRVGEYKNYVLKK